MKEEKLEQLLEKICREQVQPPEYLVNAAKQRLKSNFLLKLVTSISLFLNALVMFAVTAVFFLPGISLTAKVAWYYMTAAASNALIVLIFLNREKVILFFDRLSHKLNNSMLR
jgi:hypothetical protein